MHGPSSPLVVAQPWDFGPAKQEARGTTPYSVAACWGGFAWVMAIKEHACSSMRQLWRGCMSCSGWCSRGRRMRERRLSATMTDQVCTTAAACASEDARRPSERLQWPVVRGQWLSSTSWLQNDQVDLTDPCILHRFQQSTARATRAALVGTISQAHFSGHPLCSYNGTQTADNCNCPSDLHPAHHAQRHGSGPQHE